MEEDGLAAEARRGGVQATGARGQARAIGCPGVALDRGRGSGAEGRAAASGSFAPESGLVTPADTSLLIAIRRACSRTGKPGGGCLSRAARSIVTGHQFRT